MYFVVLGVLMLMWLYSIFFEGGILFKVFVLRGVLWVKYVIVIGVFCGLMLFFFGVFLFFFRMLYFMGSDGFIFK